MKFLSISLLIFVFWSSCRESETTTTQIIHNNSDAKIDFYMKYNAKIVLFKTINSGESNEETATYFGFSKPALFLPSWLKIVYNDTIEIIHGDSVFPVKRDITKLESFTGGVVYETSHYIEYKYEYTFTEADYQEALERHLQNKAN